MKFISTRGASSSNSGPAVSFGAALAQGLAPDGGLYMPEAWPSIPLSAFDGATSLPEVAEVMLRPFVAGDPVAVEIGNIVRDAFDFPAPLVPVADAGKLSVLELFHGPTAAFKDFGARFLAASVTPAARWPLPFIVGPASWFPCFFPRASFRPHRSAS